MAATRGRINKVRKDLEDLAIAHLGPGERLDRYVQALARTRRASQARNRLMHGLWLHENCVGSVFRADGEPVAMPTADELNALAFEIDAAARALAYIHLSEGDALTQNL